MASKIRKQQDDRYLKQLNGFQRRVQERIRKLIAASE